jgi:hypothetical protein
LVGLIAENKGESLPSEGRNRFFPLDSAIQTKDGTIRTFRIKAGFPAEPLKPYRGPGYVQYPIRVDKNGFIFQGEEAQVNPEGAAQAQVAKWEFKVACDLGPQVTDHAVGFGQFSDLRYFNTPLGFTIFGQESAQDLRLRDNFIDPYTDALRVKRELNIDVKGITPLAPLVLRFGQSLRTFHRQYIHVYPHFRNVGVIPESFSSGQPVGQKVVIRDLETSIALSALNPKQRFTYFAIDLLKILGSLWNIEMKFDGLNYPKRELIDNFMQGYFKEQLSPALLYHQKADALFIAVNVTLGQSPNHLNLADFLEQHPSAFARFLYERIERQVFSE